MPTTTVEQTTADIGKYVSARGTKFEIRQIFNGLWRIYMLAGGKPPAMCDCLYTSHGEAEKVLVPYLRNSDKLGYAVYPKKD